MGERKKLNSTTVRCALRSVRDIHVYIYIEWKAEIWHIILNVTTSKISQHLNNFPRCVFLAISVTFFQDLSSLNKHTIKMLHQYHLKQHVQYVIKCRAVLRMDTQFFSTLLQIKLNLEMAHTYTDCIKKHRH